jgi:histidyl-tRNA synthetase
MRAANKKRARVVLIFGPEELAAGGAKAKDMQGGEERIVPLDGLVAAVKGILGR